MSKVRELFHQDAIKAIGSYGETLLHYAAFYDKLDIASFLIECGINISVRDKGGRLPVDLANRYGKTGIANFLRTKQSEYDSQLLNAVYYGGVNQVTGLLDRGANIEAKGAKNETPLCVASRTDRLYVLQLLLSRGANVNVQDDDGKTPLHHAAWGGQLGAARELLRSGANIEAQDKSGWTPLHYAAWQGQLDVATQLVIWGANILAEDQNGKTPLDIANEFGRFETLRLLINQAIEQDKLDLVKTFLIRSAKKVDVPDDDLWRTTWTLLDFVAYNGNLDIVQDILKLPAEKMGDINHAESHYGCTPLSWALHYHRSDLVKPFIDLGAEIDHVDKLGRTYLDVAKISGDVKAIIPIINQAIEKDKIDLGKIYPENIGLQPRSAQRVCRRPINVANFTARVASFLSDNKELILQIYDDRKKIIYDNKLYKSSGSKEFGSSPSIDVVLPEEFTFRYGYINFTVRHDGLSQKEQDQVQKDTKAAYDIFEEKFCFAENVEQRNLTYYIFNNRADFQKYNDLLGANNDGAEGVIVNNRNIVTFRSRDMDDTLAHEITHVLQDKFAPLAIIVLFIIVQIR